MKTIATKLQKIVLRAVLRIAFYGRYSTDLQKELSIDQQLRECTAYARKLGHQIVVEYDDRAKSGTSIHKRPGLQQLLADMKSKSRTLDAIIVHDMSRLTRDQADLQQIHKKTKFHRVELLSVFERFSSNDPNADLSLIFSGYSNQQFVAKLKVEVLRGMKQQFDDGFSVGTRSFGITSRAVHYPDKRMNRGVLEVQAYKLILDKTKVPIVKRIFALRLAGHGCRAIAKQINTTYPGYDFKSNWIRSILRNPIYMGVVLWNHKETLKDPDDDRIEKRLKDSKQWCKRHDASLAIIQAATWRAVQKITRHPTGEKPFPPASRHILSGLLICTGTMEKTGKPCGKRLTIVQHDDYGCPSNVYNQGCTNHLRINRYSLEALLIQHIQTHLPQHLERIVKAMRTHSQAVTPTQHTSPARLKALEKEAANLFSLIDQQDLTGYAFEHATAQYKQACAKVDAAKAEMTSKGTNDVTAIRYDADVIRHVLTNLPKAMSESREAGQDLMRTMVKEVRIANDETRERRCPLCNKQFEKLTVIHTRQHGFEKEAFFRQYPEVGFTQGARIVMAFNPVGLSDKKKIVNLDIPETQKIKIDNLPPVAFSV